MPECIFKIMDKTDQPIVIENIKKASRSVRIFVSTREEPINFPISKFEFLGLAKGQELSPNFLDRILEESDVFECDAKAAALLSNRDYSIGDFRRKLKFKKFGEQAINEAVHKYKTKGILDDRKYALKIVNRMINEKPAGRQLLIATLRNKLIPRELAEETVDSVLQNEDTVALAVEALSKRWRQFGQFEVEAARIKSYNYLSRRGFSYSDTKEAFARLWEEKQSDNEEKRLN